MNAPKIVTCGWLWMYMYMYVYALSFYITLPPSLPPSLPPFLFLPQIRSVMGPQAYLMKANEELYQKNLLPLVEEVLK